MKKFTYYSLFSGIGGMTMGLEPLGGECLGAFEYDPTEKKTQYAAQAHKLLHPHIEVNGDVCKVDVNELKEFDLLAFTPPCQAFSVAGNRGGFEDTRGTLTFEALRIAKYKRPKVLFMENVKGLINHDKGNTMSVILHAINEIGYTIDFTVLNSKYFDVAQNRERVYLVAVRDDLVEEEIWLDINGNTIVPKAKKKYFSEGVRGFNFDWPNRDKVNTRIADFLDKKVEEKYFLEESKALKLFGEIGLDVENNSILDTRNKSADSKNGKSFVRVSNEVCPTINATEIKDPKKIVDNVSYVGTYDETKVRKNGKPKFLEVYGVLDTNSQCQTLKTGSGGNQEPKILDEIIPVITPFREEKRQNGPRFKNELAVHTITTQDRHCISIGRKRIRKLTPTECLRLQSISEEHINALKENFSDARLYKFAGNGLTTNVIKEIGEKLLKYL